MNPSEMMDHPAGEAQPADFDAADTRETWTTPSVREYVLDDVKGGAFASFEYGVTVFS